MATNQLNRVINQLTNMSKTLITTLDRRASIPLHEVSKVTGIPYNTLKGHAHRNLLPGVFQTGGKWGTWRIKRTELEKWWSNLGK
jgi:hypothetical protein